jgi:hypothetical protein
MEQPAVCRFATGAVLCLILVMLIPQAAAQSVLTLKLRVNNTEHSVYVPASGWSEVDSSSLGPEETIPSPDHFYVASYLSGLLVSLASGTEASILVSGGPGYHVIGLEQETGEPVFLAFTQGGWWTMGNRTSDLESGDFLDYVSPSFAFGLGTYHPLEVALHYTGIDITGSLSASRGIYKLVIENMGQGGGRPLVSIRG